MARKDDSVEGEGRSGGRVNEEPGREGRNRRGQNRGECVDGDARS
jgi:hypothetical protein